MNKTSKAWPLTIIAINIIILILGCLSIFNPYFCLVTISLLTTTYLFYNYYKNKYLLKKTLSIFVVIFLCLIFSLISISTINSIALVIFIILNVICLFEQEYCIKSKKLINCIINLGIVSILFELLSVLLMIKYYITASSKVLIILDIAIVSIFAIITVIIVVYYNEKINFPKFVFINILLLGLLYVFILPPFTAPDEDCHFAMSYSYSNVILGGKRAEGINNNYSTGYYYIIPCRKTDSICLKKNYSSSKTWLEPSQTDYINFYNGIFDYAGWEVQFSDTFTGRFSGIYSFIAYLPTTIGITFARIIGLGGMSLIYMGRIFNLFFYALMIFVAIKKIPFGKKTIAIIASLPMTMNLASSYSYDAVLIAASFVFMSYVFSLISEERCINKNDIFWILFSLIFLSSAKIIYTFIIILSLFIPKERFKTKNNKILFCLILFVVAALMIVIGSIGGIKIYASQDEGTNLYTFSYILHHLFQTIHVYFRTIRNMGIVYIRQMFGNYLGWFTIVVSDRVINLFIILFLLSIPKSDYEKAPSRKINLVSLITGLFIGAILLAATIMWNNVNAKVFTGFQGRYCLEILPLIAFGFISNHNQLIYKYDISKSLLFFTVPLHAVILLQVFNMIILR